MRTRVVVRSTSKIIWLSLQNQVKTLFIDIFGRLQERSQKSSLEEFWVKLTKGKEKDEDHVSVWKVVQVVRWYETRIQKLHGDSVLSLTPFLWQELAKYFNVNFDRTVSLTVAALKELQNAFSLNRTPSRDE